MIERESQVSITIYRRTEFDSFHDWEWELDVKGRIFAGGEASNFEDAIVAAVAEIPIQKGEAWIKEERS